jgi:2-(3-amino-3-carboxypropyl)histidine synthase
MQLKSVSDIEKEYDLELERVIKKIKSEKAKLVLLQFPDGLKPYSTTISQYLEKETGASCLIWLGTCYGGCDLPLGTERQGIDLIIQFGHSQWDYKSKDIKIVK